VRVSRAQAAANRDRVLDVAGRLFRERGFDGVGVADIMAAAGLTHGGFYGQFQSKDDLAGQACARVGEASAERWEALRAADPDGALQAIVASYLSKRQCDDPANGCLLSSVAVDVSRRKWPLQSVFTRGLTRLVDILRSVVPGRTEAGRRERALVTLSGMVGAVILARAVDDRQLGDEIIAAATKAFGGAEPVRASNLDRHAEPAAAQPGRSS
jgi:TetR/AcrR family transcriptional regulator, transcriptional repressor for nem operon